MNYFFFSNRINVFQELATGKHIDEQQNISISINEDILSMAIYPLNEIYEGELLNIDGPSYLYLCSDGKTIVTLSIVADRVINVNIGVRNNENSFSSRVYEQIIDYEKICHDLNNHIIDKTARKIITRRDRGLRPQIWGLPQYSRPFVKMEYNDNLDRYNSYYLDWVKYYTIANDSEIPILLHGLRGMQDTNILESIMKTDRMQCLGIALSLCELTDRLSIHPELNHAVDIRIYLLELAYFALSLYLHLYKNEDPLVDSELYAIRAKFSTLCHRDMVTLLLSYGMMNAALIDDMYVANMYLASTSCPSEMKIRYFQNALMMHQNQSVEYVTTDSMDEGYLDSINLGIDCINSLLNLMLTKFMNGDMRLKRDDFNRLEHLFQEIMSKSEINPALNHVKAFCVIYQIEKYSTDTQSEFPLFGFSKTKLSMFLDNIHADPSLVGKESEDGLYILQINHEICQLISRDILWMNIMHNAKGEIMGIAINCFRRGYELKKSVDRTHLFYGFVCQTSCCELEYSPQIINLIPYFENNM